MIKDGQLQLKLTRKQGELLGSFNDPEVSEILFGGGARGGKTRGIAEIINMTCIQMPGIVWLVGRRERDDLRKTSLLTILKVLRSHGLKQDVDFNLNMQTKELIYSNGSKLFFVPLKSQPSDQEFNWLGGYEITYAFIDEAQEVEPKAIAVIKSRLTEKVKQYNIIGKIIMGCNPDKGHLYSTFIRPSKEEIKKYGRVFIQSLYKDNPYIDHKKYEDSLTNADDTTRQRLLFGNWEYDDTKGKLFRYDEILDLFESNIEKSDTRFISCDVARLGKDNTVISLWEGLECGEIIKKQGLTTDMTAKLIKEYEKEYGIHRNNIIIDSDGVGGGVADQLRGCVNFINNGRAFDTGTNQNYGNLKAQCYFKLKELAERRLIRIYADGEIKNDLVQELSNIMLKNEFTDQKIQLESKEDMKKRLGRSPDISDSIMMRMYYEVCGIGDEVKSEIVNIDIGNFLLG